MTKQKVAVTMRIVQNDSYFDPRDAISHDWIEYFSSTDICPILVPNSIGDVAAFLEDTGIEKILLTNGDDVGGKDNLRDQTESKIMDYAIEKNIPVLGICRGFQYINVYCGGSLSQVSGHVAEDHSVNIINDTWKERAGEESFVTNSFHNQGVMPDDLADCLEPFAVSDDASIEGYCHKEHFITGILWHPERKSETNALDRAVLVHWMGQ
ncbi:MAG: gamma-glutamyl-gamma-aminobutyrate hydrolase family protein [Candidatus Lindowbacteria bacterium]|nr:gamma-glutamyl-gamma-aminobutyrate hydrolase family protein [Candidatus Lindowbacteria bacterium]